MKATVIQPIFHSYSMFCSELLTDQTKLNFTRETAKFEGVVRQKKIVDYITPNMMMMEAPHYIGHRHPTA